MTAHILHINQHLVTLAQNCAVNGTCFQIQRWQGVDLFRQSIQPACAQFGGWQGQPFQTLHHVAEHCANRTARCAGFLLHLFFIAGLACGTDHHHFKVVIIFDCRYLVIVAQHALIAQKSHSQIFGVVANRHGGDDFLRIQENRQRAFFNHANLADLPCMVTSFDCAGQPRIGGVRKMTGRLGHCHLVLRLVSH